MATYRERREAKAERLQDWATKRHEKAQATFAADEHYRGDHAFNFQPGHIPERARMIARTDRAHESIAKARQMESRAEGIQSQLDQSIYSDDPDAIPALERRIRELEAERDRAKAFNVTARKGHPDESLLDAAQVEHHHSRMRFFGDKTIPLANLNGNIKRNRDRLEQLKRKSGQSRGKGRSRTKNRALRRKGIR